MQNYYLKNKYYFFYKKIKKLIKIIFLSKKSFSKFNNIDILIFNTEKDFFEKFIENKNLNFHYLDSNLENINLLVLLKLIFNINFFKITLTNLYIIEYIKFIKPKLVITFSDNNIEFYKFKKYLKHIKFAFVQNGLRRERFDIFEKFKKNDKYYVDYMFVMNESVGKEYNKFIEGEAVNIGSLKNNFVELRDHEKDNTVLFLSQYTSENNMKDFFLKSLKHGEVTYEEFYHHETIILNHIKDFCLHNHLNLKILGRPSTKDKILKEYNFFNGILQGFDWTYLESKGMFNSYTLINNNLIIVSADCTLGYEALSRNKKVVFFPFRNSKISDPFGWPHVYDDNGLFWSCDNSKKKFFELMNYTINLEINDWKKLIKSYKQNLMFYDKNNSIFNKKILEILS